MKNTGLILAICILFTGCVYVRSVPCDSSLRKPKPDDYQIEIVEAGDVNKPYKVIGFLDATAVKNRNVETVLYKLKKAAKKMGGDALIELHKQPVGIGVPAQDGSIYAVHVRDLWKAKVIVWQEPN